MKLLLANNFYYLRGGSERVFFDEIEMLQRHDQHVAVFSCSHEKNLNSIYSSYFTSPIYYESVSTVQKAIVATKLFYSTESRHRVGRLMDTFLPDLMHVHNITGRLTTAVLDAARARQIPTVMTLHDSKLICPSYLMLHDGKVCDACNGCHFYHCLKKRCHKGSLLPSLVYTAEAYMSRIFRKYDSVSYFLCPSRFLLEKHAKAGISPERLIHLPNSLNLASFTPDYSAGRYVLYAGRLSHEKGIVTLLDAMRGLHIPLKIVGDGPLKKQLEALTRCKDLNNVEFVGYRTGEDLKALFSGCAFLVLPSECYENAPMTILEAYASGKPVIGSSIGGIPEMVKDGETGYLFPPGDSDHLKAKISQLFADKQHISSMGRQGRKVVEAHHSSENHYNQLMKIYEAVRGRGRV